MCGADDCPRCFPANFHGGVYLDPYDDELGVGEQMDEIDEGGEEAAIERYIDTLAEA
jgi:hypothetical protein